MHEHYERNQSEGTFERSQVYYDTFLPRRIWFVLNSSEANPSEGIFAPFRTYTFLGRIYL